MKPLHKTIPYGRQCIDSSDIREVIKTLKSDFITQGSRIREFESAVCQYVGAKYAVAVSSGTAALHLSSLALGIEKNSKVITSPITFVASANCILYSGGHPIFIDVSSETINLDPAQVESYLEKKNKIKKYVQGMITVDFAGQPASPEKFHKIAKKFGLFVLEDASHAFGAKYLTKAGKSEHWIRVGSCAHSDLTVFSFHPVKHITTGEGGMVTTNNSDLYQKILELRNHGIVKPKGVRNSKKLGSWYYEMRNLGFNYRMTDFQAALGISQLKKIDRFISRRREIASQYIRFFKNIPGIQLVDETENCRSVYHLFILRFKKNGFRIGKAEIFNFLRKKGLLVQVHYIPVYRQPYYQKLGFVKSQCPKAEAYYEEAISIPIYPSMTDRDINYVTSVIQLLCDRYAI